MTFVQTVGLKVFFLAVCGIFAFYLTKGLLTGSMHARFGVYASREEDPAAFWTVGALNAFFLLACLVGTILV